MRPSLRPVRLFGIPLTAGWSWLFLALMLAYVADATLETLLPQGPSMARWPLVAAATLLSLASLFAHELAHALVAVRSGVPVRGVSLYLLGGVTQMLREAATPGAELRIALAGPLVSLAIGLVAAGLAAWAWGVVPGVAVVALWLALLNLPLGVFNLLPAYPLDGGRVLRAVLWFAGGDAGWGGLVAARAGLLTAATLFLGGLYTLLTHPQAGLTGLWLLFIAWFVYVGARSAGRVAALRDAVRRLTVGSIMDRDVGRVEVEASLRELAEIYALRDPRSPRTFAAYHADEMVGLVVPAALGRIAPGAWAATPVLRSMIPLERLPVLTPDLSALEALELLAENRADVLPVIVEGRLLGVVTRQSIARAVEKQRERSQR